MKILKLSNSDLVTEAIRCLESGGLIIFPTETVYGVGVDATNQEAVEKLLKYKSRREGKPLSIAVFNQKMADEYVEVNDQAQKIYNNFLPGPFTVISQGKHKVAQGVESEFGTLGVRIPDYDLILEIVKKFGKPITATSANASGKKRPYTIDDVFNNISQKQKDLIDLVIDAGKLPSNLPSTVIDTTLSTPITVRQGDRSVTENTSSTLTLTSRSTKETQDIAGKILLKNWEKLKSDGLIIGLNGSLGAGKTIFTKGIANFLCINENIVSPTYSYINEYDYLRHGVAGKLFHLDVWKVDDLQTYNFLEIENMLNKYNLIIVEWWNQIKQYWPEEKKDNLIEINIDTNIDNQDRILNIFQQK